MHPAAISHRVMALPVQKIPLRTGIFHQLASCVGCPDNGAVENWFADPVKILLIEDDKETSAHIVYALDGEGHEVTVCHDGLEGLNTARAGGHAALIVDRMLPGLDGLSLVKQLRAEGNHTPVLFLTTMSGLNDRVEGLKGAETITWSSPSPFRNCWRASMSSPAAAARRKASRSACAPQIWRWT